MTAVFDLDETLTRRDTFLPFLLGYLRRRPWRAWRLFLLPAHLLWIAVTTRSAGAAMKHETRNTKQQNRRTRIKQAVLKAFLGGAARGDVAAWAETYAERLAAHELRPGSLAALREHQEAGDRVVLATASFDIYVRPLATRLGIDEVLCSRIAWDAADPVAGIDGENCRDHEKLRQVIRLLGEEGAGVVAYSDSHADLPLLEWAERGVAVSPTPLLAARVQELGLDVQRW